MAHFLEARPFKLSDPAARELWAILSDTYYRDTQIEALLRQADIRPATINFAGSADLVWADVLVKSRNQGKLRPLLDVVVNGDDAAVAVRVQELVGEHPPVSPGPRADPLSWKGGPDGGDERQLGDRSTLLDVAFLRRGTELAAAVCRLKVTTVAGEHVHGTAFRIGERRLLTNHHVLYDGDAAPTAVEAWFGYERTFDGADLQHRVVEADAATVRGRREHDWAVVDLPGPLPDGVPILGLTGAAPPRPGDRVYIIQHPFGGPKQIGMIHNQVRHVDADVVQYWTDTEAGSSGAPVFDERWRVVALHHRYVTHRPEGGVVEYRNQGRRIERVVAAMAAAGGMAT